MQLPANDTNVEKFYYEIEIEKRLREAKIRDMERRRAEGRAILPWSSRVDLVHESEDEKLDRMEKEREKDFERRMRLGTAHYTLRKELDKDKAKLAHRYERLEKLRMEMRAKLIEENILRNVSEAERVDSDAPLTLDAPSAPTRFQGRLSPLSSPTPSSSSNEPSLAHSNSFHSHSRARSSFRYTADGERASERFRGTIGIAVSGKNLLKLDPASRLDPCCLLYEMGPDGSWTVQQQTETIKTSFNPSFKNQFVLDFDTEENQDQQIRFQMQNAERELLGRVDLALKDLVKELLDQEKMRRIINQDSDDDGSDDEDEAHRQLQNHEAVKFTFPLVCTDQPSLHRRLLRQQSMLILECRLFKLQSL